MHKLIVLMGRSGSGKTTIAQALYDIYGLKSVSSYTTRPPRYDGEKGHIFIDRHEYSHFDDKDIAAYQLIEGNHYFTTWDQLNNSNIYVIDPHALVELVKKNRYEILPIYLNLTPYESYKRMIHRGDQTFDAIKRRFFDNTLFNFDPEEDIYNTFHTVDASQNLSDVLTEVVGIIKSNNFFIKA